MNTTGACKFAKRLCNSWVNVHGALGFVTESVSKIYSSG